MWRRELRGEERSGATGAMAGCGVVVLAGRGVGALERCDVSGGAGCMHLKGDGN